jgi:hypothetical protein
MFVNEFSAYSELGKSIKFKNQMIADGTFESYKNGTLTVPSGLYPIWNVRKEN